MNPENVVPQRHTKDNGHTLDLPGFYDTVMTLDQVVDVDYSLPGCPPTPDLLRQAVRRF